MNRAPLPAAATPDGFGPPLALRAGPVTVTAEAGGLRGLRVAGREAIRRIYVAVRDRNWGTVPVRFRRIQTEVGADSFRLVFDAVAQEREIDFRWQTVIAGTPGGEIRFTMTGVAHSEFMRNRIGFCVLHPAECHGARCRVRPPGGEWRESRFPDDIAPANPFTDLSGLSHEVTPDVWCRLDFEGELFETEDQRNWTDASFKTFCTPLHRPFPVRVPAGTRVDQTVRVTLEQPAVQAVARTDGAAARAAVPRRDGVHVTAAAGPAGRLPALGLALARLPSPLTPAEQAHLLALRPAHLRLELDPASPDLHTALRQAGAQAAALACPLEIALYLDQDPAEEIATVARAMDALRPPVCRWLVLHRREKSATHTRWVELARDRLARFSPARFGTGTDYFFNELNQQRPPSAGLDFVCFSINPQVHAFDEASMVETLTVHGPVVTGARRLSGGAPVVVSPITLKMRSNPVATGPVPAPAPGEIPPQVDPRQTSLFTAAWTLGSIAALAGAGAEAATYFETTGWLGVIAGDAASPLPGRFPSVPGTVFPVYHVLADVNAFATARMVPLCVDDPLQAAALALDQGTHRRVLLANLAPEPQTITLAADVLAGTHASLSRLGEAQLVDATTNPPGFRQRPGEMVRVGDGLALRLAAWEVVRLDIELGHANLARDAG